MFQLAFSDFQVPNETFSSRMDLARLFKFDDVRSFVTLKKRLAANSSLVAQILSEAVDKDHLEQKVRPTWGIIWFEVYTRWLFLIEGDNKVPDK